MTILRIVTQYLFYVYYFRTFVPSKTTAHQIPVLASVHRHFLNGRECRNGHCDLPAILKHYLKLPSCRERNLAYCGFNIPISFYLCHIIY